MSTIETPLAGPRGELLSAPMLADQLGVDVRFIYRLVQGRRIAHMRIGKELRFTEAAVREYLASITVEPVLAAERAEQAADRQPLRSVPAPAAKPAPKRAARKPSEARTAGTGHRYVASW